MTVQEMVDYINGPKGDDAFWDQLNELIEQGKREEAVDRIKEYFNKKYVKCDEETANSVFVEFKKQVYVKYKWAKNAYAPSPEQVALANAAWGNMPKCPTCTSTNIQKIGDWERFASVSTLGLLSKKINKTFKCKNCGYMW